MQLRHLITAVALFVISVYGQSVNPGGGGSGTGLPSGSVVSGPNLTLPGTLSIGGTVLTQQTTQPTTASVPPILFAPMSDLNPILTPLQTPLGSAGNVLKDPAAYTDGSGNIAVYFTYGPSSPILPLSLGLATNNGANSYNFSFQNVAIAANTNSTNACGAFSSSQPIYDGSTWHIWYTAVQLRRATCGTDLQTPWNIGHATASSYLGPWTPDSSLAIDGNITGHILDPWVLPPSQSPDGLWRLYASEAIGNVNPRNVVYWTATTASGPWTYVGSVFNPPVDGPWTPPQDSENPAVFKFGQRWYMILDDSGASTGQSKILVDVSGTATHFVGMDDASNILSASDYGGLTPGSWDQAAATAHSPLNMGDRWIDFYQGGNNGASYDLGIANLGRVLNQVDHYPPAIGSASYAPAYGNLTLTALARPSILTVSPTCTGTCGTTYTYVNECYLPDGSHSNGSASLSATNAATLDGSHFNTITTGTEANAKYCLLFRTVSPGTTGVWLPRISPQQGVYVDTGATADSTVPDSGNSTGLINGNAPGGGAPEVGYCSGTISNNVNIQLWPYQVFNTNCLQTSAAQGIKYPAHTWKNLYVTAVNGPGPVGGGIVTVQDNGSTTALTCTLSTNFSCSDTTHSFTSGAGDFIRVSVQSGGGKITTGPTYSSGASACTNGTQTVTFSNNTSGINAAGTITVSGGVPTGAATITTAGSGYAAATPPTQGTVATCTGTATFTGGTVTVDQLGNIMAVMEVF